MYRLYISTKAGASPKVAEDLRSIQVCKEFTEKVSVAGLEELNSERDCPVRLLFAIGLSLAAVLTIATSFKVVQEYLNEKPSLEIKFKHDGQISFPNVTVCTTAVSNITAAENLVIIPKPVEEKLVSLGVKREELVNNVAQFMYASSLPRTINKKLLRYIDKTWAATAKQFENPNSIVREALPSCSQTLFNCFFDGQPFDCCTEIVLRSHDGYVCYGIPVADRFGKHFVKSDRKALEFNVNVQMDWRHIPFIRSDDAYDGFLVIVGQPYTTTSSNPIAVAPGWHATVKLAQIKHRYQTSRCVSRTRLPKMAYVPYYDEDGKNCEMDNWSNMFFKGVQCVVPMLNYRSPNNSLSCNFRQMYTIVLAGNGELEESGAPSKLSKDTAAKMMFKHRQSSGYFHEHCYPICERWQYEPIVGYSELRNDKSSASDFDRNVSWSKITVLIPSSYYELHSEGARSTIYILISNIGKSICIYAGVSMVTFMELFGYGLHSCYLLRKKRKARKIQPANLIQSKPMRKTNDVSGGR